MSDSDTVTSLCMYICPMRCRREVAACTLQQLEAEKLAQLALASICTWSDLFIYQLTFYIILHNLAWFFHVSGHYCFPFPKFV